MTGGTFETRSAPAGWLRQRAPELAIGAALFGATFAFRLFYNYDAHAGEWPDVYTYYDAGRQLWRGEEMQSHIIMPLFPLLFGYVGPAYMEQLNLVFHAMTSVAVYALARGLTLSRFTSALATSLVVISPLLILYSNVKLSEVLYTCLLSVALLFVVFKRTMPAAIFLTLGTLVRPIVDMIAPVLILFSARSMEPRSLVRTLGVYAIVYVVLMAPWWVYNYQRFDTFVPLNMGGGYAARLENSDYYLQHGFDMSTMFGVFEPYYPISDPVERDRQLKHDAVSWIVAHPVDFLHNTLERTGRYLDPRILGGRSYDLWFMLFTYTVYLLALAFIFMAPMQAHRRFAPLYLTIIFVTALTVATHAVQRYRLPIEPLLYIMAAAGFEILRERWARFVWDPGRAFAERLTRRLRGRL